MSAIPSTRRVDLNTKQPASTLLVPVIGLVALLARAWIIGSVVATPAFVAIMVFIAVISLGTPIRGASSPLLSRPLVLLVGAAAVSSTLFLGPTVPLAHGPLIVAMSIGAAISEELFFRRLVFGTLVRWGVAVAIVGSAVSFAAVHMPLYGPAVFWVDLGAGLVFSWQRWASGDWYASAATHSVANLLAVIR